MEKTGKGHRIYLKVPYEEKEEAKQLGARWDPDRKQWYVPPAMTVNVSKKTSTLLSMWNIGGTGDEDKESQKNGNQRSVHRRSPRCGGNPGHANIATTSSAMANAAVRPGDSIPKRFINPLTPCAAGP